MFSLFKSKPRDGLVGLEVRADGIGLALSRTNPDAGAARIELCVYEPCSAAERKARLDELVNKHDLAGYPCNLVLSADKYQTFPVEKPKVDDSEVSEAARWRIKDLLDYDLELAVTDVYDFPKDALRGRPDQLNVIASRKTIVQDMVNLVNESDLELNTIDIADLAMRNIAMIDAAEDRASALLYLRNGAGMMVLVKNDLLYFARHFEFSVQALNEPSQQDSVMQQLALEIQRSFDYFESQMGQVPPQELTLFGPDPNFPLVNMLGGTIAAKVVGANLESIYNHEDGIGLEQINGFVAMGAALRGAE